MTKSARYFLSLLFIILLMGAGYAFLTMPDQRSTGQRVGDAIDALPQGPGKAAEQVEKRTPGEKLGDAIKDSTSNNNQ